jgi:hypothetical protein
MMEFPMHLSATAITALLLVAGVGSVVEAAPAPVETHTIIAITPTPSSEALQGRAGDGSAKPGDGSVAPALAQSR